MMQESIVAVIVAVSAWVVVKRFMPPAWQRIIAGWSVRAARAAGWSGLAGKLEARTRQRPDSAGACGTCGNCGTADKAPVAKKFAVTPEALKRTAPQRGNS
jgi:hypothetical protein